MHNYKYKTPEGKLYKVPVRKWNKHFGSRGRFTVAECYINEPLGVATIQFIPTTTVKVLTLLLLPLTIILHGVINSKEVWRSTLHTVSPKRYGAFSSDVIWKDKGEGSQWEKLLCILEIKND